MVVKTSQSKLPEIRLSLNGSKEQLNGKKVTGGNLEFEVPGDAEVKVNWK